MVRTVTLRASETTAELAKQHRRFLKFLSAHVKDRSAAEEILQACYVISLQKAGTIRRGESATAWFYRVLRHAVVDYHRALSRQQRIGRQYRIEQPSAIAPEELKSIACSCIASLVGGLRSEYATALRRVELENATVPQLATEFGITPGNAAVRLHRAREALRRKVRSVCGACAVHGCVDCSCQPEAR